LYFYAITQVFVDPPELVVDVTAAREAWQAAIECHKSQMKTRNYLDLVMSRARTLGAAIGVEYAVLRVVRSEPPPAVPADTTGGSRSGDRRGR